MSFDYKNKENTEALVKEVLEVMNDDIKTWKTIKNDGEESGVKTFKKPYKGHKVRCIRAEGVVDVPPSEIVKVMHNIKIRHEWNPNVETATHLEDLGYGVIQHMTSKSMGPLSKREFLFFATTKHLDDGSIITAATSIAEHPGTPKTDADYVRGEIILNGVYLKPYKTSDGKDGTLVQSIVLADPKGNIPKAVVNKAIKKGTPVVTHLRDYFNKQHGKK